MSVVLGVNQSIMRARWRAPEVDDHEIALLARRYDLPEIAARLLAGRGIEAESIPSFLNPTLRGDFPDPFAMAGMRAAAEYLAQAITDRRAITIFGDFDVDGATSSALLCRFFRHFGLEAPVYIPDRLSEGYGPNTEALKQLKEQGAEIVVMADCGTTAFEVVKAGRGLGLEIVILDHHEAGGELPAAHHIVNPKRKDDESGLDMLAACGVAFMLCVAVNNVLREKGFYKSAVTDEPDLKSWLDIVALGTVCDMVPLTGVNRLFVRLGFSQMAETKNPGIRALIETAKITPPVTPYHAGFILGPRINAGSRVHRADLGAKLLSTNDPQEAVNIAWTLNDCNEKRKDLQRAIEEEAIAAVEKEGLAAAPVIIVGDEGWHPGLSGLVAGRLKEKYGRPACVVTYAKDLDGRPEGRGSGRSVPGIHMAQALMAAVDAGLLEKGGGHAMAGGFTIRPEKLAAFKDFMTDHIARQAEGEESSVETAVDGIITVQGLRYEFVELIHAHIGPFGQAHPEPVFVLANVRLHAADIVGGAHIRLLVSDWEGGPRIKAMAFRAVGTPLGEAFLKNGRQSFHLAGTLKADSWQGRRNVELHVLDAAFAGPETERAAPAVLERMRV